MANVFADLLTKGAAQGMLPAKSVDARNWFRKQAQTISTNTSAIANDKSIIKKELEVGGMYFFRYDAKLKKELPYWDAFPLIFPVDTDSGGFYGLNFHYLPYALRARFMDALYTLASDKNITNKTKMQLTYNMVRGVSKAPYYKACLKYYLNSHVKSNFYYIDPTGWDIALFLPVESFQKANRSKVFADSIRKVNG